MVQRRLSFLVVLLLGCEPAQPVVVHQASATLRACNALSAPVPTIERAVDALNVLPKPVDAPCFVASLPRPLRVTASNSVVSAQPAASRQSPRIFVLLDGLAVTVVPEGDSAAVVEFGEWRSETRTVKGEVALPVTTEIPRDTAFTHVFRERQNGTTCGLCHTGEVEERPGVYSSVAYRPHDRDVVPLRELRATHDACVESGTEDGACAMLHALFDFGDVEQGAFNRKVGTFGP